MPRSSARAALEGPVVPAASGGSEHGGVRRRAANPAGGTLLCNKSRQRKDFSVSGRSGPSLTEACTRVFSASAQSNSGFALGAACAGGLDGCRHKRLRKGKGLLLRMLCGFEPDEAMELRSSGPPEKNYRLRGLVTVMRPNRLKTLPDVVRP